MPALSKTSIPSHSEMSISRFYDFPDNRITMPKLNVQLWKQARLLGSLDNLKGVDTRVKRNGNLIAYSHQKENQTVVLKGIPNSNTWEKLNNLEAYEFLNWIATVPFVLFIAALWNCLQKFRAEIEYQMTVVLGKKFLGFLDYWKPTISVLFLQTEPNMKILTKCLGHSGRLLEISMIWGQYHLQVSLEMKGFSKYIEHFCKLSEMPAVLDPFSLQIPSETRFLKSSEQFKLPEITVPNIASNDPESQTTDYWQRDEIKYLEVCNLCQETISKKKFFDERRYGILRNCDCVICYGCIRNKACTSGWGEEPVICPLCSVKSDTVVASASWIQSKDKPGFFETYFKNTEYMKRSIKDEPVFMLEKMTSEPTDKLFKNCTKYLSSIFTKQLS